MDALKYRPNTPKWIDTIERFRRKYDDQISKEVDDYNKDSPMMFEIVREMREGKTPVDPKISLLAYLWLWQETEHEMSLFMSELSPSVFLELLFLLKPDIVEQFMIKSDGPYAHRLLIELVRSAKHEKFLCFLKLAVA